MKRKRFPKIELLFLVFLIIIHNKHENKIKCAYYYCFEDIINLKEFSKK